MPDPRAVDLRSGARVAALHWLPLLLYLGAIHYLSGMSQPPQVLQFRWDKAGHFVEFLFLAVLTSRALFRTFPAITFWRIVALSAAFGFLYGTVDEYHQSYIPGRMADIFDAVADGAGAFVGAFLYAAAMFKREKRGEEAREQGS